MITATATTQVFRVGGTFRAFASVGMKAVGAPDVVVEGVVLADPVEESQAAEPLTRITWGLAVHPLRPEVAAGDRCGDGRLAWRA
jgi:hypothetical protein